MQRRVRNSPLPVVAVHEKAGDPPVGRSRVQLAVPAHSSWKLGRGSELTPANNVRSVVDEGRVGVIRSNKPLLQLLVLPRPLLLLTALEMEGGAPATTPYTMMLLDDSRKVRPGLFSEFPD